MYAPVRFRRDTHEAWKPVGKSWSRFGKALFRIDRPLAAMVPGIVALAALAGFCLRLALFTGRRIFNK